MNTMNLNVTRRNALRGLGTLLALPWMESLASAAPSKNAALPRRFVGMYHTNGVNPWKWYPTSAGRDYVMPENLALLKDLREDLTVFSGLAHFRSPQSAGHWGLSNLLTGCGNGGGVKFHTSVSLDQYLAPHIGNSTRIPSLNLSCKTGVGALNERIVTMSFGQRGNPLPTESNPRTVFERLFVEPTAEAKARFRHMQSRNQSILDNVTDEAKSLNRRLGRQDQQKLDDYLTNVRSVELQMQRDEQWLDSPRYQVDEETQKEMLAAKRYDFDLMLEIVYLSLISDVTRVVTFVPMEEGGLYHGTSHWNRSPEKSLPEMDKWDRKWIGGLAKLGGKLKAIEEGEGTFLDRTSIVYGGGHGRRPHYSHDLPILLMGGKDFSFRHGQHLAFQPLEGANPIGKESSEDQNKRRSEFKQTPLSNLYVFLANGMGVPTQSFADSTGELEGVS